MGDQNGGLVAQKIFYRVGRRRAESADVGEMDDVGLAAIGVSGANKGLSPGG